MLRWSELIKYDEMMHLHVKTLSAMVNLFYHSLNESYYKDVRKIFANDSLSDKAKLEAFYLGDHGAYKINELKKVFVGNNGSTIQQELEKDIQGWIKQGGSEGSIMMNIVAKEIEINLRKQDKLELAAGDALNKIYELVKQNEAEYKERPVEERLFVYTLAIGGYIKIQNNQLMSNMQKLQAILAEANRLIGIGKFNIGAKKWHHMIRDQAQQALTNVATDEHTSKRKAYSR